jgi:hypothetical protein
MENNYFKYYKPSLIIGFIGGLAILIYLANKNLQLSISVFTIVAVLIGVIDEWFWHYKPFLWLFTIQDFRGSYESILEYEFRNELGVKSIGQLKHLKEIHQTGSKISITSTTYKADGSISSVSKNKNIIIERQDSGDYSLIYTYLNNGDNSQSFPPHYGTDILTFSKKENQKKLMGNYYTDRLPYQTRGKYLPIQ